MMTRSIVEAQQLVHPADAPWQRGTLPIAAILRDPGREHPIDTRVDRGKPTTPRGGGHPTQVCGRLPFQPRLPVESVRAGNIGDVAGDIDLGDRHRGQVPDDRPAEGWLRHLRWGWQHGAAGRWPARARGSRHGRARTARALRTARECRRRPERSGHRNPPRSPARQSASRRGSVRRASSGLPNRGDQAPPAISGHGSGLAKRENQPWTTISAPAGSASAAAAASRSIGVR